DALVLGGARGTRADRDTARDDRSAGERLAPVPGAVVPAVGALRLLPVGRGLRVPRSAPGRARVPRDGSGAGAEPDPAPRRASVRRGRRAPLVAPAARPRHPYALRRRPAVAAVCGCAV